jgi:hypothetical protein
MRSPLRHTVPIALLVLGCSAGKSGDESPLDGATRDGGSSAEGGLDLEGGLDFDASLDGGTSKPLGCSGDLQSVTDGAGVVQKKCPADQGCYKGACVPACEAAAKSKGNVGCDFVAATPSFYPSIKPPCFAVFLANNWSKDVKISVARGGSSFDVTSFGRIPDGSANASAWPTVPTTGLPPGQVAVLFMSSDPGSANAGFKLNCPVAQALAGGTAVVGSGRGTAFTIKTDAPVSAYDILPYGGASSFLPSAELLLPTSAWGTNYVAVVPQLPSTGGPQWGQVVASENGTTVTINPTSNLPAAGGLPAAPKGTATKFTLNAGEFVQWQPSGEMSGSVVSSDKPVSFVGGTGYLCLSGSTSKGGGCDSGHQMIPPVSALGSEYAAAPYVTRRKDLAEESILYRIVGTVDGTKLVYEPPVAGAPTALAKGTFGNFEATGPFVVKSQDADHPFYLAQVMSGCNVTSGSRPGATVSILGGALNLGDEEFVNLLPPAQFLTKYVFFTDPTYSTTNLVLTRVKGATGFKDVKVDCLGTVSGWKPMGGSGTYEWVGVDLVRSKVGVGSCKNGPQVASSDGQFGLMVWGTDTYSSYAYPGGGNVGTINTVVVDPVPK